MNYGHGTPNPTQFCKGLTFILIFGSENKKIDNNNILIHIIIL